MDKFKLQKNKLMKYSTPASTIQIGEASRDLDLPKLYTEEDIKPDTETSCVQYISETLPENCAPNSNTAIERQNLTNLRVSAVPDTESIENIENQVRDSNNLLTTTPKSMKDVKRPLENNLKRKKNIKTKDIQLRSEISDYFLPLKSNGINTNQNGIAQNVTDNETSLSSNSDISSLQTDGPPNTNQKLSLKAKLEKSKSTLTPTNGEHSTLSNNENESPVLSPKASESVLKPTKQKKQKESKPRKNSSRKRRANEGQDNSGTSGSKSKKQKETPRMDIVVKKADTLIDGENDKVPVYKTVSKNTRGNVLLINNISFAGEDRRDGSEVDVWNMKNLFQQMGFNVQCHTDLTLESLTTTLELYSQNPILETGDIQVVIIMSHGNSNKETYIETIDRGHLEIEWIVDRFSNNICVKLAEKPKIFIFQCCRGKRQNEEKTDSIVSFSKSWRQRAKSDVLIAYATVPDYASYRHGKLGSRFIRAICEVFPEHAHDTNIVDLLTMVDNKVNHLWDSRYFQTCCVELRGFKKCYLNPI
ncbi:Caspase domain [Popillia japonica]|uniref:Caspase domain n=1 Tax=Popillia japonica TaxID=7064 RepID=A0AAW1KPG8_POPJA